METHNHTNLTGILHTTSSEVAGQNGHRAGRCVDGASVSEDRICGIDRYEHSPEYGKLVLETVLLWHKPGSAPFTVSISGVVLHGDKVEVLETMKSGGALWAKVKCTAYEKEQVGWLVSTLLEDLGKEQPGIKCLK